MGQGKKIGSKLESRAQQKVELRSFLSNSNGMSSATSSASGSGSNDEIRVRPRYSGCASRKNELTLFSTFFFVGSIRTIRLI